MTDWKQEREHINHLIRKTDQRIDKLMMDLRGTEPQTQVYLIFINIFFFNFSSISTFFNFSSLSTFLKISRESAYFH